MKKKTMYSIPLNSFIKALKKEQNKGNTSETITFSIDKRKNLTVYYGNNPIVDIYNDKIIILTGEYN